MGCISPGNFDLIKEAMDLCDFPKGARILDAGCGEGDTLAFLEDAYGVTCTGIDRSSEIIQRGREKHPLLDLREGEMEFLDFPSLEFDGVVMECALSLSSMRLEALHEAWCVLKKGGKLIITDLYAPSGHGLPGAFAAESLFADFDELGFERLLWSDKTPVLHAFAAEKVFEYGSLAAFWEATLPPGAAESDFCRAPASAKELGYFLAVLKK
jgi:ubiquinone/menaquinone biosynthesis C-methylase UbiE